MSSTFRLACFLVFAFGSNLLSLAQDAANRPSSSLLLPMSTKAWFSFPDWDRMTRNFNSSNLGQLAAQKEVKEFSDSVKKQIDDYLNEQNFRLGITAEDVHDVRSGEVCFAGVLPPGPSAEGKMAPGSHGIVLLIDIAGNEEKAGLLLEKIGKELVNRKAVLVPVDPIQGTPVQRYRLPLKNPAIERFSMQAMAEGWLVASDNETVFREVLRRVKNQDQAKQLGCLSDDTTFQTVMKNSAIDSVQPDFKWFVEPFGYLRISQAIADEQLPVVKKRNDYAEKLQNQGFDVFRGVGGIVALDQMDNDVVFRHYLDVTINEEKRERQERCLRLFGLENVSEQTIHPTSMVPSDATTWMTCEWNISQAFDNIGPIADEFEPGMWDATLNGFVTDMNVDLREIVRNMGSRISLVTRVKRPVDVDSEEMAIVIPMTVSKDNLLDQIAKILGGNKAQLMMRDDIKFVLVESVTEEEPPEIDIDGLSILDDDDPENFDQEGDDEGLEPLNLFEKKFFAVGKGADGNDNLIIANSENLLFTLLLANGRGDLKNADDFLMVEGMLNKLSDPRRVCIREFGRNEQVVEMTYELLRKGKMASSQTVMSRIMNHIFQANAEKGAVREQSIDGSTLPEDYAGLIAPWLGPSGWVSERTESGWRMSGGIIKRKMVANRQTTGDENGK